MGEAEPRFETDEYRKARHDALEEAGLATDEDKPSNGKSLEEMTPDDQAVRQQSDEILPRRPRTQTLTDLTVEGLVVLGLRGGDLADGVEQTALAGRQRGGVGRTHGCVLDRLDGRGSGEAPGTWTPTG